MGRSNSLLNRSKVKQFALDSAKASRAHPFSRVSEDLVDYIEGVVRMAIHNRVKQNPSKGKTLV